MDPLTLLLTCIPAHWAIAVLVLLGIASVLDAVVPQVEAPSRWAIPRALLHAVGMNFDKAAAAVIARRS